MLGKNHISEAKKLILRYLKSTPADVYLLENISKILIVEKKLNEAEKYLQKLVQIKNDEIYLQNLMILKFDLGKFDESNKIADQILSKNTKNNVAILYKVKNCENVLDDINMIEDVYQKFTHNKNDIAVQNSYGLFKNKHGKCDEAIKIFEDLLKENDDLYIKNNLAVAYMNSKKYEKAISKFEEVVNSYPTIEEAYINLSYLYDLKQNKSQAKEVIKKLVEKNPNSTAGIYQLAYMYSLEDRYEDSNKLLMRINGLDKDNPKVNHLIGINYIKLKEYKKFGNYYKWRTKDKKNLKICKITVDDFSEEKIDYENELIIFSEQGLGDQIFHCRFIKLMDHKNMKLVAPKKMINFYKEYFPEIDVIEDEYHETELNKKNNISLNLASLIRLIDTEKINKVRDIQFNIQEKDPKINQNKIIGISWKSNGSEHGEYKSFSLEKLLAQVHRKNYQYKNLQYGDINNDIKQAKNNLGIEIENDNKFDINNNILDLVKKINQCDFVITCSNVTAHVAGLVGKKTYLLMPNYFGKLWFWTQDEKSNSYWYPNIKIICNNNWEESFLELKELLK